MSPRPTPRQEALRAALDPICHALVLGLLRATDPARDRARVRAIVDARLPGAWEVRPIGRSAWAFEIRRARRHRRIALGTAWNHCHRLEADSDVEFAEPSVTIVGHDPTPEQIDAVLTPAELTLTQQARASADAPLPCAQNDERWSIESCRIDEAWALEPGPEGRRMGEGIVVGHPDTGYTRHPEVWDAEPSEVRVLHERGHDFEDGDSGADDPLIEGFMKQPGHGTATSSVILSGVGAGNLTGDPQRPVTGVAPRARLIPLRVTRTVVLFNFTKLAAAIDHAVDEGAHVISISLGGPYPSTLLEKAVGRAVERGVVVLAAAGNVWPFVVFPARLPSVIGVAASNCEDGVWKKSARGGGVDLCAPGEGVWRADAKGPPESPSFTTGIGYGTSFAVATVAGACALWLAHHGRDHLIGLYGASALVPVFRHLLLSTVRTPLGWDTGRHGAGILDAKALLEAPLPHPSMVAPLVAQGEDGDPGPLPGGVSDALAGFFPEADAESISAATCHVLRVPTDGSARSEGLPRSDAQPHLSGSLGREILFHVATNPELRAAIDRRYRGTAPAMVGSRLEPQSAVSLPRLRGQASRRLRAG
ncbi:MAG: S8/S53 family peptidase [Gemmatimonadetes bacterium]|nr:S8/S53 family peptidase [Gemmatimonadota bacterium]